MTVFDANEDSIHADDALKNRNLKRRKDAKNVAKNVVAINAKFKSITKPTKMLKNAIKNGLFLSQLTELPFYDYK